MPDLQVAGAHAGKGIQILDFEKLSILPQPPDFFDNPTHMPPRPLFTIPFPDDILNLSNGKRSLPGILALRILFISTCYVKIPNFIGSN